MKKKIICFDIDGVICKTLRGNYKNSKPIKKNIEVINSLDKDKYKIILYTARFMGRTSNNKIKAENLAKNLTLKQLKKWNVKFDEVYFGKPSYDVVVDDKAIFFKKDWNKFLKKFR
tara:strand:+ start:85 stop:432 length:348 start_codon:yes stop_codon:yes gene_type:complete